MPANIRKKLEGIRKIGVERYRNSVLIEEGLGGVGLRDPQGLLEDDLKALKWFIGTCFLRGRNDNLSGKYARCAFQSIDDTLATHQESLIETLNANFQELEERYKENVAKLESKGKPYRFNPKDIDLLASLVQNFLPVVRETGHENIVRLTVQCVEKGDLWRLYYTIDEITQVSGKISSLFLRDIVSLFGLERFLKQQDYMFLFPIDTWVSKVITHLHPDIAKKDQVWKMVSECLELHVSPISVNQGMWYLGARTPDYRKVIDGL